MIPTILEAIDQFEKYNKDVEAALEELRRSIKSESKRSHLQKLLYIALVNRFDSLVDTLLIEFSSQESTFSISILESLHESTIDKKEIYEMFLSENPRQMVLQKLQEHARINYLNKRHAEKLSTLLKSCYDWSDKDLMKRRVHTEDGRIYSKMTSSSDYPRQIPGYADWLYSRRNALVHNSTNQLFSRDIEYIERHYGVKVPESISLRLSSLKTCATFYINLCAILKSNALI